MKLHYTKMPILTKYHHEDLNIEKTKNAYSIDRASSQINLSSQSQKRHTHTLRMLHHTEN